MQSCTRTALNDLKEFMTVRQKKCCFFMHTGLMRQLRQAGMEKGRVAIFDASNVTRKFRIELVEELRGVVQV